MKRFFNFVSGYYVISSGGERPLDFVNRLKKEGVYFWGLKNAGDGTFLLNVSVFSGEKALKLAFGADVKVICKKGLPFVLSKYKKRYGVFFGVFLGALVIYASQFYLWDVRIDMTNAPETDEYVLDRLRALGCRAGAYIPGYDVKRAELLFLIENPEFSFISINVAGTVANIDVKKRDEPPEIIDKSGLCDIVAENDGVIISVEALQGTPKVSVGDTVFKGDTLISCVTVGRYGTYRLKKAIGSVKAVVYHTYQTTVPLTERAKVYTGETEVKTSYEVVGKRIDLFRDEKSPYARCDAETVREKVYLFGVIGVPVIKERIEYKEYRVVETETSAETAKERAMNDFYMWCARELDGDVLETETEFTSDSKSVTLKCFVKVAEDISEEKTVTADEALPEIDSIGKTNDG